MTDATAAPGDRVRTSRTPTLIGVMTVAVSAVVLARWIAVLERSPGWGGPVFAVTTAAAVAAIVGLTKTWADRRAWVAAAGVVLVAIGSGIGRPRDEIWIGRSGSPSAQGEVIGRLATWWPLVALGLALGVAALIWALVETRGGRSRTVLATGSLLTLGVGYVAVAVLVKDLVVGQWISGRPIRGCRRETGPVSTRPPARHAGGLWLDAAADEAAAVAAFSELAVRLRRVGAPEALVDRCVDAAVEEERHERICRRIAEGLGAATGDDRPDGSARSPLAARVERRRSPVGRPAEVVRLAVESFVDGVVGEGFAARRLDVGSATVVGADGRAIRSMANEEQRHATLGADIARWSLEEHPVLVGGALRAAARRLPAGAELPASHGRVSGSDLRRAGLVDADGARELWSQQRTAAVSWLDQLQAERVSARGRRANAGRRRGSRHGRPSLVRHPVRSSGGRP